MKKISMGLLGVTLVISGAFVHVKAEGRKSNTSGTVQSKNHPKIKFEELAELIYEKIDFGENPLSKEVFMHAYKGYKNLEAAGKLNADKSLLSVCDFNLSSTKKRLWIIDLKNRKILYNSLVAHGQGTGEEFAERFSNRVNSHQSSLGFYVTSSTYQGSNGYSMKLLGMDKGYNDQALQRAIVLHGASYVSEIFILANRRIGRSWGCPAVPLNLARPIIDLIKEGTCLYVHHTDENFLQASVWLDKPPILDPDEALKLQYEWNQRHQIDTRPALSDKALASANDTTTVTENQKAPIGPQVYQGVRLAGSEGGIQP